MLCSYQVSFHFKIKHLLSSIHSVNKTDRFDYHIKTSETWWWWILQATTHWDDYSLEKTPYKKSWIFKILRHISTVTLKCHSPGNKIKNMKMVLFSVFSVFASRGLTDTSQQAWLDGSHYQTFTIWMLIYITHQLFWITTFSEEFI